MSRWRTLSPNKRIKTVGAVVTEEQKMAEHATATPIVVAQKNDANPPRAKFFDQYYWYFFAGLVALIAFFCFFQLGASPVRNFDEARHGSNAFEMLQRQDYLVNYYNGSPDYWNLKPPLSYYLIMLGYRIFGYNAWGLRFFSALCYLVLAVVVALYLRQRVSKATSLLSLVLFSGGYLFFFLHFARSGDADAAYVLCFGLAIITLEISNRKPYFLTFTGLLFALMFLLKSFHASVLLPIIFCAYFWNKQYRTLRWYHYILAVLAAVIPVAIWAICRYQYDGMTFFKEMLEYDVLARTDHAIETNNGFPFYYTVFFVRNFIEFFGIIICSIGLVWKIKTKQKLCALEKICLIAFLSVFVVYVFARTKLYWYMFPCCVPLFLWTAKLLPEFWEQLQMKRVWRRVYQSVCAVVFVVCMLVSGILVGYRVQEPNELQDLLATCEFQDGNVYYQDETSIMPSQNVFLCLQWRTGRNVQAGGWEQFLTDHGAYIIVTKQFVENHGGLPDEVSVVRTSTNYWLCFYH